MKKSEALRWSSNLSCRHNTKKRDLSLPRFILMTDDTRLGSSEEIIATLKQMPPDSGIIVRSIKRAHLASLVKTLRPVCTKLGIKLMAAAAPQSSITKELDGIHLSERSVYLARPHIFNLPRGLIITASAHSEAAVLRARQLGVDGIFISPVFPTRSHPARKCLGAIGYRRVARHAPNLACPLGGITPRNLEELTGAPVNGVAGIGLFCDS